MSISFTKLDSTLTDSTVWAEPDPIRIVWITMLSMADKRGQVNASVPGLANRARKSIADVEEALALFMAPDKYSRTKDHDGRRIAVIDGGWQLLNYGKYRNQRDGDDQAERHARNQKAYRDRNSDRCVTERDRALSGVTGCDHNADADADAEAEADISLNTAREAISPEMVAQAVLQGCRLSGRWLLAALIDVAKAEMDSGADPDKLRDDMIAAWRDYVAAGEKIEFREKPENFFGNGTWRNRELWRWRKDGKSGDSPAVGRVERSANAFRAAAIRSAEAAGWSATAGDVGSVSASGVYGDDRPDVADGIRGAGAGVWRGPNEGVDAAPGQPGEVFPPSKPGTRGVRSDE